MDTDFVAKARMVIAQCEQKGFSNTAASMKSVLAEYLSSENGTVAEVRHIQTDTKNS